MQHHPGDALLAACAAQAAQRLEETSPQELSRLLWGFAELKRDPGPAALAAYAAHAAQCIHKASPQLMAKTLMGFAKLGHAPDGALLRACEAAAEAPAAKLASQPVVREAPCPAHSTSEDQIQRARKVQAAASALPPGALRRVPGFATVAAALAPQRMLESVARAVSAAGVAAPSSSGPSRLLPLAWRAQQT